MVDYDIYMKNEIEEQLITHLCNTEANHPDSHGILIPPYSTTYKLTKDGGCTANPASLSELAMTAMEISKKSKELAKHRFISQTNDTVS